MCIKTINEKYITLTTKKESSDFIELFKRSGRYKHLVKFGFLTSIIFL